METISKSISAVLDERLSSPLISSFAISWSLWNYKFFVILFSNNSVLETFRLIEQVRFPSPLMWMLNGVLVPLALTALYIYALPYPSKFVYDKWSRTQKETKDIKQRWADLELLAPADAESLRLEAREGKRKYEEIGVQLEKAEAQQRLTDHTIRELQSTIDKHAESMAEKETELLRKNQQIDVARNAANEAKDLLAAALTERDIMRARANAAEEAVNRAMAPQAIKLNERQADLLLRIAEEGPMLVSSVLSFGDRVEMQHWLDSLTDDDLVDVYEYNDEHLVSVTKKGRAYVVESLRSR